MRSLLWEADMDKDMEKYVHIGVGEHWVKCGHIFGTNYGMLGENDILVDTTEEARCVVCGKLVKKGVSCLTRDY